MITDLTGLTNKQIKESEPFFVVFNRFWKWCQKQKTKEDDKLTFYTYGNFDKILLKSAYKRRPKDKRLAYIIENTIDIQIPMTMSLTGSISNQMSLLNATKLVTGIQDLEQDHDALKDAFLLKLLCNSFIPNIENLIEAEKSLYMKRLKKDYGSSKINNKELKKFVKNAAHLKTLSFQDISHFIDAISYKKMEESVVENYILLGGNEPISKINFNSLYKKGEPE